MKSEETIGMANLTPDDKIHLIKIIIKLLYVEITPNEIFSYETLIEWAKQNCELVSMDEVPEHVRCWYEPSDIFEDSRLERWALENGFVRKEN